MNEINLVPHRPAEKDGWLPIVLVLAVLALLFGGTLALVRNNNDDVRRKVDACLAAGGVPIVSESRGFDHYHGCAHP